MAVQYIVTKKIMHEGRPIGFIVTHPISGETKRLSRRLIARMIERGEIANLSMRENPNGIEPILFGIRGTQIENLPFELAQDYNKPNKTEDTNEIENTNTKNLKRTVFKSPLFFNLNYIIRMYIRLLESPLTAYNVSEIQTDYCEGYPAILFKLTTQKGLVYDAVLKFIATETTNNQVMISFEVKDTNGATLLARSVHGEDTGVIIGNVYGIARNN